MLAAMLKAYAAGSEQNSLSMTLLIVGALFPIVNPLGNAPHLPGLDARASAPRPGPRCRGRFAKRLHPARGLDPDRVPHPGLLRHLDSGGAGGRRPGGTGDRMADAAPPGRRGAERRARSRDLACRAVAAGLLPLDAAADGRSRIHLGRHHGRGQPARRDRYTAGRFSSRFS